MDYYLEENKLKSALSSLIQWFKDKIKLVKEKIAKLMKKDIPPEKKGLVSKIKGCANSIIGNCKQGISACKQGAGEKAKSCKDKVMSRLGNMSDLIKKLAIGGAVVGGAVVGRNIASTKAGYKDGYSAAKDVSDLRDQRAREGKPFGLNDAIDELASKKVPKWVSRKHYEKSATKGYSDYYNK